MSGSVAVSRLAAGIGAWWPFGALFVKELRVASRRKRNHLLRVVYLATLLLIMLLSYASVGDDGGNSLLAQAQRQSQLGASFFGGFLYFSVIAMGVIGPVLTCTAIGAERTHKTLPVLLMTPLNAWQIVAGKLVSRMLLAGMLIGLSLPVLALVRLLGGVESWQMGAAIALSAATGLFAASVGLWLSTMITRAYAVILASYGVLAFLYVFIPFVLAMLLRGTGTAPWVWVMGLINPVYSAAMIQFGSSLRGGLFGGAAVPWWYGAVAHVLGAVVLTGLSAWLLRRQQRREDRVDRGLVHVGYAAEPLGHDSTGWSATPDAPRRHRAVGGNPIRWRELRQPVFQKRWLRVAAWLSTGGVLGVIYLLFGVEVGLDDEDTHVVFAVMYNAVVWLLAAVVSATAIAQEKEGDTWTVLLTTPLAARRIVLGKLAGVLWRMKLPVALVVLHFLTFAATGAVSFSAAALAIGVILCFNAVWVATGLYLSLRLSKVSVAVVVNLLLGVGAYLGLMLVEAAAMELVGSTRSGPFSGLILPYWYLVEGIELLSRTHGGTTRLPGLDARMQAGQLFDWTCAVCVAHLLVGAGVLRWTIARFDRIVGRAPQASTTRG